MIKSVHENKGKGLKMNPIAFLHDLWTLQPFSDTDWGADKDTRNSVYGFFILLWYSNHVEEVRNEMCSAIQI